jgi:bifunctional DNase/RNase
MIRVSIINVFLTAKGDEFIILLRGPDDKRTLPISIGQLEAQSIATQLYHVDFPRPLTHDLFKTVLDNIEYKVSKVVINDIIDSTFYARLFFEKDNGLIEVDSRPSDGIALALRFSAPIFVEERVMDESGVVLPEESAAAEMQKKSEEKGDLLSPERLNEQLHRAIKEERYEDAAHLRDTLKNLSKSN